MLIAEAVSADYRGDQVVLSTPEPPQVEQYITAAYLCGWACADASTLELVPQSLVNALSLKNAEVSIIRESGELLTHHAFPAGKAPQLPAEKAQFFRHEEPLNEGLTFRLTAQVDAPLAFSAQQRALCRRIAQLTHAGLAALLLEQRDHRLLGPPFDLLTDHEWTVVRALERFEKERVIAEGLNCSWHTLHGHVKKIYTKLNVNARGQLIDLLKSTRDQQRLAAMKRLSLDPPGAS